MKFVTNQNISGRNYLKDITIVSLCYSMYFICLEMDKDKIKDENLIDKSTYKYEDGIKEMVDENIDTLKNDMLSFMNQEKHYPIAKKMKIRVRFMLDCVMPYLQSTDNLSLEVLASYIMYNHFTRDDSIFHENFKQWTYKERYSIVVDSLDASGMSLSDKIRMHNISKEILVRI